MKFLLNFFFCFSRLHYFSFKIFFPSKIHSREVRTTVEISAVSFKAFELNQNKNKTWRAFPFVVKLSAQFSQLRKL